MTTPGAADPEPGEPRLRPEPTVRVGRPPVPGRAGPAATAAPASEPGRPPLDEPTVTLPDGSPPPAHRTIRFGRPDPVKVTVGPRVGPRVRPRRRYRTWPWIATLAVLLLVLGAVLLVMLWRGATVDGDVDLVGRAELLGWAAGR